MAGCAAKLLAGLDNLQQLRPLEREGRARIFVELAKGGAVTEEIMIDSTHLKAHRTAASLLEQGLFPGVSVAQKAD